MSADASSYSETKDAPLEKQGMCFVPDCADESQAKGACMTHYANIHRWQKMGHSRESIARRLKMTEEAFVMAYVAVRWKHVGIICACVGCDEGARSRGLCAKHYQVIYRHLSRRAPLKGIQEYTGAPMEFLRRVFSLTEDYPEIGEYAFKRRGAQKKYEKLTCFACEGPAKVRGACASHYQNIASMLQRGRSLSYAADYFGVDLGLLTERFSDLERVADQDDPPETEEEEELGEVVAAPCGTYADLTCNLLLDGLLGDGGRWVSFHRPS